MKYNILVLENKLTIAVDISGGLFQPTSLSFNVPSTTVVTVASAYNTNYVAVATGNWGVYSESLTVTAGETRMKTPTPYPQLLVMQ